MIPIEIENYIFNIASNKCKVCQVICKIPYKKLNKFYYINNLMDTKVLIIGGGPSGLLLSLLLTKNDIDNIILEKNTALHVANRIRAGILEPGTVKILKKAGIGKRLSKKGIRHNGFNISFNDQIYHINIKKLLSNLIPLPK